MYKAGGARALRRAERHPSNLIPVNAGVGKPFRVLPLIEAEALSL